MPKSLLPPIFSVLLYALQPVPVYADLNIGGGVTLGDDLATLHSKLRSPCESLSLVSVNPPRFPLAAQREQHLLCNSYRQRGISWDNAVFTLADDRFVRMEAVGVSAAEIRTALGEPEMSYLGFDVFQSALFWLSEAQDSVIWLDPEGLHPNLFAWRNPLLTGDTYPGPAQDTALPRFDAFEQSMDQQLSSLQISCSPLQVEEIEEIWLRNQPKEQRQANCFNFAYAGFERKIEFVYGDGKLEVMWILTAKAEEQRVRELLVAAWGAPSINNADWEVFDGGRIALRKDTPELLLLSEEMLPMYRETFENPD